MLRGAVLLVLALLVATATAAAHSDAHRSQRVLSKAAASLQARAGVRRVHRVGTQIGNPALKEEKDVCMKAIAEVLSDYPLFAAASNAMGKGHADALALINAEALKRKPANVASEQALTAAAAQLIAQNTVLNPVDAQTAKSGNPFASTTEWLSFYRDQCSAHMFSDFSVCTQNAQWVFYLLTDNTADPLSKHHPNPKVLRATLDATDLNIIQDTAVIIHKHAANEQNTKTLAKLEHATAQQLFAAMDAVGGGNSAAYLTIFGAEHNYVLQRRKDVDGKVFYRHIQSWVNEFALGQWLDLPHFSTAMFSEAHGAHMTAGSGFGAEKAGSQQWIAAKDYEALLGAVLTGLTEEFQRCAGIKRDEDAKQMEADVAVEVGKALQKEHDLMVWMLTSMQQQHAKAVETAKAAQKPEPKLSDAMVATLKQNELEAKVLAEFLKAKRFDRNRAADDQLFASIGLKSDVKTDVRAFEFVAEVRDRAVDSATKAARGARLAQRAQLREAARGKCETWKAGDDAFQMLFGKALSYLDRANANMDKADAPYMGTVNAVVRPWSLDTCAAALKRLKEWDLAVKLKQQLAGTKCAFVY